MTLNVTSEIGKLRSVLVHLPGPEIDRMVPSLIEDLGRRFGWGPDMDYRLRDLAPEALAGALVAGLERPAGEAGEGADLFWLPPVPNYFFQRDPLVVAADRTIRCSMATPARAREPLLSGYVFRYHPRLGRGDDAFWFDEFPTD